MGRKFDLVKCRASIQERMARIEARLRRFNAREPKRPLIFLGPSLSSEEARTILDADFRAPIARGDLVRALEEGYGVFGVIDGVFHQHLTVSIEEIRYALEQGASIYGASSMGALRAAEAFPLGMQGVGRIYRWYRDEIIDCDDEVAVTFDAASGKGLSEPAVNLRATLERAEAEGKLGPSEASLLLEAYLKLHFTQRNLRNLFLTMSESHPPERITVWRRILEEGWVDQKALDAVELLRVIGKRHAARTA